MLLHFTGILSPREAVNHRNFSTIFDVAKLEWRPYQTVRAVKPF